MRRSLIGLVLFLSLAGCTSTGDADHPIHYYGWRFYVFGHEKYTQRQAAYDRCMYQGRLPDGTRSGFSRQCRLRPAVRGIPMGINSAMDVTACEMELCAAATAGVPDTYKGRIPRRPDYGAQ